ncbi:hypothetical protein [Campylobacter hyointestinalis]|uniref:hypothetical protein n=1 Tax=Campylobacter hyointestinalis TaxID=198 RepID=UPI00072B3E81|nr:hypothetical protein [Campylobacter hyointestinalis]CUU91904.1 Uncharacterised protein [Campylobacter hyointestinalis subsp. hyointestinalis]
MNIDEVLKDRSKTHGDYKQVSKLTIEFLSILISSPNWEFLSDTQKTGLIMVLHKITRILCGNKNEIDHYKDILGYTKLMLLNIEQTLDLRD